MIVIVNYGIGNLRSVYNKLKRMGVNCIVTSEREEIKKAKKLILPGVGHFKNAMQNLHELGLIEIINRKVIGEQTPILGICLGTQLFAKYSEEGDCKGLGWIDAEVIKFKVSNKLRFKVPHMGWNNVSVKKNANRLDKIIKKDDQFYFVHSYHLKCNNPSDVWMTSDYNYEFVSAVNRENIYGTQFHPEKSHDAGFVLLKSFVAL